ncbi:MAG: hypothetical protein R3B72_27345 [Polyangiaceae bacterium]
MLDGRAWSIGATCAITLVMQAVRSVAWAPIDEVPARIETATFALG